MDKQNVTLSIPKELLLQAKIVAIRRNHSLSSLLTSLLAEMVENEEHYEVAKRRSLARLATARSLQGDYTWSRESLHER